MAYNYPPKSTNVLCQVTHLYLTPVKTEHMLFIFTLYMYYIFYISKSRKINIMLLNAIIKVKVNSDKLQKHTHDYCNNE